MRKKRSVSQLVATLILIAIILVGGVVAYSTLNNTANIASQYVQVTIEAISFTLDGERHIHRHAEEHGTKPIVYLNPEKRRGHNYEHRRPKAHSWKNPLV
ncbi:hypothetical protein KEJ24_02480 [Candidatus Bathyarchaeota archaeon]|nr:hypothetical protein [Candidatus Bathyarchaeota archaeon]